MVKLESVSVTTTKDDTFGTGKMGAGTAFNAGAIISAPTIRRSIQDLARLDSRMSLSNVNGGGELSAMGQNNRFNSFLVDGVRANDPFGLNANGFSSLRSPVPLDALEALTVELSPYDVRRSGFTGAMINGVTKSGTNNFHGSAAFEYTNQDLRGKNPLSGKYERFNERTYTFTFGGPLLKDRLFFFLAYDDFRRESVSDSPLFKFDETQMAQIDQVISILKNTYNYDPGTLDAGKQIATQKTYLAKIDWNITQQQRASFSYLRNDGVEPIISDYRSFNNQTSLSNHWYLQPRLTNTYIAQLFSSWTPDLRTEGKISYSQYDGSPEIETPYFPEVTINNLTGLSVQPDGSTRVANGSVVIGSERSRHINVLETKTLNGNFYAEQSIGAHTLVYGLDGEQAKIVNQFVNPSFGRYDFGNTGSGASLITSLQHLAAGRATRMRLASPLAGGQISDAFADVELDNIGAVIQDTWRPNSRVTLAAGLRLDYPHAPDKPLYNETFFATTGIRNDTTHSGNYTLAPRTGFNVELPFKRKTQVRGGIGLFQGTNPNVWIVNAYQNNGRISSFDSNSLSPRPSTVTFVSNPGVAAQSANVAAISGGAGLSTPSVNVTNPGFKAPSSWKANVALDHQLPFLDLIASVDYQYSWVNEAIFIRSLSLRDPAGTLPDGRFYYSSVAAITPGLTGVAVVPGGSATYASTSTAGNRRFSGFAEVYELTNTREGNAQALTFQLKREVKNHWGVSFAYTRSHSTESTPLTSSIAGSNFTNRAIYNPNNERATTSSYSVPDRIVASVSVQFEPFKRYKSTATLIYEGRSGRPYSWVYTGDANGDGISGNDLFYIASQADVDSGLVRFRSAAEQDTYFAFMRDNPSLARNAGRVAPRNGERSAWISTFDIRMTQELPVYRGVHAQLFANIINLTNLLNDRWGRTEEVDFPLTRTVGGTTFDPAARGGLGQYTYTVNPIGTNGAVNATLGSPSVQTNVSRWQVQFGARVKF
ncbi:MAG: hypothetical protein IPP19_15690 [Verrucomicrobia bacterium]|nr:hypothetical protein [Verrucomicrobiota bacterium]